MIKIKFIGEVGLTSKGIHFIPGAIYEVKPEVAEYLKNTFNNIEIMDEPKVKATVVAEAKEAPKEGTKIVSNEK